MEINKYIDHTNLKAYATKEDIKKLCLEAKKYNFKSVCVNPIYVEFAKKMLKETEVLVCTVIGFPLGANTIETKKFETTNAIKDGADEIDMVISIGSLKEGNYDYVKKEIEEIRQITKGKTLKVIIETCYLTSEEIKQMTKICSDIKVDFIKTSTGFGTKGAQISDVKLMNEYKDENLQIKASGGIKNIKDANNFVKEGATRLGTSSGIEIMKGEN